MYSLSASSNDAPVQAIFAFLRRSWAANRALTVVGVATALAILFTGSGLLIDPRVINGSAAWLKPAKFAISLTIHAFTFVWMLRFVQGPRAQRLAGWAANATALATVVELLIISGQAARGLGSHFNVATALDSTLYSIMGLFALVLWGMIMLLAIILLRQRLIDPAFAWSLRLGLLVAVLGAGVGPLMTAPSAAQLEQMQAGAPALVVGAHAIGAVDAQPGLPLLGWSSSGGDLRVGHFVGIHAMQVLPFVGWMITRRRWRWLGNANQRLGLVWTFGMGYLGLTLLVIWQAYRAQPLLAPDATTLLALGALVLALLVASTLILLRRPAG